VASGVTDGEGRGRDAPGRRVARGAMASPIPKVTPAIFNESSF